MAVLVTGATGFIGEKLCNSLAADSQVVAFCRRRPGKNLLNHPNIRIAIGDVTSLGTVLDAMKGCDRCVHLAALASQWSRRRMDYYDVNAGGTRNVLDAAVSHEIDQFVFVSTAGVYGPTNGIGAIEESSPIPLRLGTDYERSKRQAEKMVMEEVDRDYLNACIVCPTRVFGPGQLPEANSVTRIMQQYLCGRWWILPGDGSAIGNYIFVDDVVEGLIRALNSGTSGARYILGGENISYRQLFDLFAKHSGSSKHLTQVPYFAAMAYARIQKCLAIIFGRKPKLTPEFARKYYLSYRINDQKTRRELGLEPKSIETAVKLTMQWLAEFE